jgi:hypothetical protein
MRPVLLSLRVGTLIAVLYLSWVFLGRLTRQAVPADPKQEAADAAFARTYLGSDVKIIHFYAREASVVEGGTTVICYGVVNAVTVRTEPPLAGVGPAISRCVEAPGERATRYTLIAEGKDGRAVSESFLLGVHPDTERLPKITSFREVGKTIDYLGNPVYLVSFTAVNPEEVTIDPPVLPKLHRSPFSRFYVAPKTRTTYTLTVTGIRGHKATQQLTLDGRAP